MDRVCQPFALIEPQSTHTHTHTHTYTHRTRTHTHTHTHRITHTQNDDHSERTICARRRRTQFAPRYFAYATSRVALPTRLRVPLPSAAAALSRARATHIRRMPLDDAERRTGARFHAGDAAASSGATSSDISPRGRPPMPERMRVRACATQRCMIAFGAAPRKTAPNLGRPSPTNTSIASHTRMSTLCHASESARLYLTSRAHRDLQRHLMPHHAPCQRSWPCRTSTASGTSRGA